jgi:hypothetical protein
LTPQWLNDIEGLLPTKQRDGFMKRLPSALLIICLFFFPFSSAIAWHDRSHIAVGTAAKFDQDYNLAGPDVAKLKAGAVEEYNHWANNLESTVITKALIKGQIQRYNVAADTEKTGHLYGAIIAAIRAYQDESGAGKFATYHLAYAGHYIGDLSMPLHNISNPFNESPPSHYWNDHILESEIASNIDKIKIFPITINSEENLIENIAVIARRSKDLGYTLVREKRDMTKEEAYEQISQSASLFKAVLQYVGYLKNLTQHTPLLCPKSE